MARETQKAYTLLNAANSVGSGVVMDVESYRNIMLAIDSASSFSGTLKVQGSISDLPPTWVNAQTVTNQWSYIQLIDLNDQSTVTGATGVVATGTDVHRLFEVNTNGLKWLNVQVTAYSAGTVSAVAKVFDNL